MNEPRYKVGEVVGYREGGEIKLAFIIEVENRYDLNGGQQISYSIRRGSMSTLRLESTLIPIEDLVISEKSEHSEAAEKVSKDVAKFNVKTPPVTAKDPCAEPIGHIAGTNIPVSKNENGEIIPDMKPENKERFREHIASSEMLRIGEESRK